MIVDDVHAQDRLREIVILVFDPYGEAIESVVAIGGLGKFVGITDRTIGNGIHRERTEGASESLAFERHGDTVDQDSRRAIRSGEEKLTRGEFTITRRRRTSRRTVEARFQHKRAIPAGHWHVQIRFRIANGYDEIGRRRVAVAVDNCIGECVREPARRARIARIGPDAFLGDRQAAVGALHTFPDRTSTACAGIGNDRRRIGALGVVVEDVAADRTECTGIERTGIVARKWRVVGDSNDQRRACLAAIAVSNQQCERVAVRIAERIVSQRITIAVNAILERHRQVTLDAGNIAATSDIDIIDDQSGQRIVAGTDHNVTACRFAIAIGQRACRLAIAGGQAGFVDRIVPCYRNARRRIRKQRDRDRCVRYVAVAIGDCIGEGDITGFCRTGQVGKRAVAIVFQAARSIERVFHQVHIGKLHAVSTAGIICKHIDRNGSVFRRLRSAVIHRQRIVVGDVDDQRAFGHLVVEIRNHDVETDRGVVTAGIVAERIFVVDCPFARHRIIHVTGDDERPRTVRHNRLRQRTGCNRHTVDCNRADPVGRVEGNCSASGFALVAIVQGIAIGNLARTGGFIRARGQSAFAHLRARTAIRDERDDRRRISDRNDQRSA